MASVVTIGGGASPTINVTVNSASVAALAQQWVAPINQDGTNGTLVVDSVSSGSTAAPTLGAGQSGLFAILPGGTGSFTVPSGYQYASDSSSSPVTIFGAAATTLSVLDNQGGAYNLGAATQTVVAGGGNWLLGTQSTGGGAASTYTFLLDTGNDTVVAAEGNASITTAVGSNTILDGTSGNVTVNSYGSDAIAMTGTGNATVNAFGSGVTAFGGAGNLTLINQGSGSINVFAGSGSNTIVAGQGGGILQGGTGGNNLIFGGAQTTSIQGGGTGDSLFAGSGNTTISAGAGNETLSAAGQSANDYLVASSISGANDSVSGGNGSDTIFAGGGTDTLTGNGGTDYFVFANQYTDGNTAYITDFTSGTDYIGLSNYSPNEIQNAVDSFTTVSGGGSVTLGDGTKVILEGVTSVSSANFVNTSP